MDIETVIEALNRHIESTRESKGIKTNGHLVVQKVLEPDKAFKIYKTYTVTIWYIKDSCRTAVLSTKHTSRIPDSNREELMNIVHLNLCYQIFNWIGSDFYEQIINGTYKGYLV